MDYIFNICNVPQMKCKGNYVGAFEALEVLGQLTETCEVLGRAKEPIVKALSVPTEGSEGVRITYTKGDICSNSENPAENGQPRNINFNVFCANS